MWRVHVDMTGKLAVVSGCKYKYFVLAVCSFTKYVEGEGNFLELRFRFFISNFLKVKAMFWIERPNHKLRNDYN